MCSPTAKTHDAEGNPMLKPAPEGYHPWCDVCGTHISLCSSKKEVSSGFGIWLCYECGKKKYGHIRGKW